MICSSKYLDLAVLLVLLPNLAESKTNSTTERRSKNPAGTAGLM
jgi:hypothetical protein